MLIVHLFVSYAHVNLCHFFSSSLCRGLAAASACGSSWTFLFTFLGNNFVYCSVNDVERHENDFGLHEVSCVYRRRVPIKLALLGENTDVFNIGWIIKRLLHGCLAG